MSEFNLDYPQTPSHGLSKKTGSHESRRRQINQGVFYRGYIRWQSKSNRDTFGTLKDKLRF